MSNKLREIREQKDLTLEQVAKLADTSIQQIQRLEKGERRLTTQWIKRLAKALGVKPSEIVPELADGADDPWLKEANEHLRKISDAKREALMDVLRNWPRE